MTIDKYVMRDPPSRLYDFLRTAEVSQKGNIGEHANLCNKVKANPLPFGLDNIVEWFEGCKLINHHEHPIGCPDLIAFQGDEEYTVIEIGTTGRTNRQLKTAFRFIFSNFRIRPRLIRVRYGKAVKYSDLYAPEEGWLLNEGWSMPQQWKEVPELRCPEPKDLPWPSQKNPPKY